MVRRVLTAMACSAVMLAVGIPGVAQGAKEAERPSGKALVRIDGGTAYAKDLGKGKYRLFVPDGASITWLGEVGNKGTRIGTFTPKALVSGWSRLGQREGDKAYTTLTWGSQEFSRDNVRVAALAKPRINADGDLTFVALVLGQGLPRELPGFSINVARAATGSKSVTRAAWDTPIVFEPFDLDSTASIQATVSSNNTATVTWPAASGYTNPCRTPITLPGANGLKVNLQGFTCGDLAINSKVVDTSLTSFVQMIPSAGSTTSGCGFVVGYFGITPPASTGKSPYNFNQAFATWGGTGGGGSTTNCSWAGY